MQASGVDNEREVRRLASSKIWTVMGSVALVTAIVLGSWWVLKPAEVVGPQGSNSRQASAEVSVTRTTGVPLDEAARRNLELQAQQPNPFVTALRDAVGPGTSEADLQELSQLVNLLLPCDGSTSAQAVEHLTQSGLEPATAEKVIAAALAVSECSRGLPTRNP